MELAFYRSPSVHVMLVHTMGTSFCRLLSVLATLIYTMGTVFYHLPFGTYHHLMSVWGLLWLAPITYVAFDILDINSAETYLLGTYYTILSPATHTVH